MRILLSSVVVAALAAVAGCAPLTVQQASPASLDGVKDVSFLGAYDARVMNGGVQTTKTITTLGSTPVYGAGGYMGTAYYPQNTVVRTGEIAPNDALKLVAEGFSRSVNGASVSDLSGTSPLEVRTEMGMDWFAKNNPALSNYLVSIEVKSASVFLDDAAANYRLGIAALTFGILSPCLACTTAPCLAYPLVAVTKATSEASGTLRVYDKKAGHVVERQDLRVTVNMEVPGFHDSEQVFALMSQEAGKRLGYQAAEKLRTYLAPPATTDPSDPDAPPIRKPTPSLDRPAGSPPPAPGLGGTLAPGRP
ncbi:MAG: hypothetical protein Q8O67_11520 [Deltaproteobacteria bacterium]|nr:hypothetical protein [Deltaproteobacteria bacterium]